MQRNPPAAPAVRDVLKRVLQSETFARSDRARKLLGYLVEREQAGDAERLKGFTIAMDVFGKDTDFDPSTDAVVRVQAGRLRELLTQYYANEGAADPLRIDIPRGGYVPSYSRARRPAVAARDEAALGAADAGSVPSAAVAASPRPAIVIGQVRLFWTAMAAVIAMLLFIVVRMVLPAAEPGMEAAAVPNDAPLATGAITRTLPMEALPTVFVRAVPDSPQASRVAATLRMALARFDTVDLLGRDPGDAHDNADLAFAFEISEGTEPGSVNLQVINVGQNRVLLTRTLAHADLEAARLEDHVADLLSAVIPPSGVIYSFLETSAQKPALVDCLLLNDDYYLDPSASAHRAAYACLEGLVAASAKSPLVYSELASLNLEAFAHHFDYPPDASGEAAMALALRAVKMAPTSAAAHRALGYVSARTGKRAESIRWMKKAYELNTYDLGLAASYAYALIFSGDYKGGAPVMERAVEAASAHPAWWDYGLFLGKLMEGDMARAAAASDALAATKRSHYLGARLIAAKYEGDLAAAGALAAEIAESYPKFAADPGATFREANYPTDMAARLVEYLRAAGLGGAS
ncbi:MAG: hypothetical protein KF723_20430 [Rhizobiaceae bacterium]|nr:hypothetical protein [Rhizobiaceae bacterium]